jgi:hypothetical protein
MVDLEAGNERIKGVVGEVGLVRDIEKFNSFNLTINMVVDSGKAMTYEKGERLMNEFRKELLGKKVEIAAIVVPCPICGKGFNTEQGMKQHMRMVHDKKKKGKAKKTQDSKAKPKRTSRKRTTKKIKSK